MSFQLTLVVTGVAGRPTVPCLRLVTEAFHLKIHRAEVMACFVLLRSSSRRWTSFNWKFWPSQRPLSISLDPGRRLSSFGTSSGKCPVWCYPPICTWVFLV